MPAYAALLRAVNLGPTRKIKMTDLKDAVEQAGFEDAKTILQSGNVVFRSPKASGASLEKKLEAAVHARAGLLTEVYVRDAAGLDAVVAGNPFDREAKRDPSHLLILFTKDALKAAPVKALEAAIEGFGGRERIVAAGTHAYLYYPDGIGHSKLTAAVFKKHLGAPGTARNWNTVQKLLALLE